MRDGVVAICYIAVMIGTLLFWGGLIYVVHHFVVKYW